jgi:hypothetical protein
MTRTKIHPNSNKICWGDKVSLKDYQYICIVTGVGLNTAYDFVIDSPEGGSKMVKRKDLTLVRKSNRGTN